MVPHHPIVSSQAKLRRSLRIALRRLVGRRGHSSWATTWWRCQLGASFFLRTDVIRHSTSSSEPIKVDVDWYWNQFIYVFRFAATYATLFYLIAVMPRIQVLNSIFLKCLIYLFLLVICTTYSFLFEYVCCYALLFRRVLLVELLNQKIRIWLN